MKLRSCLAISPVVLLACLVIPTHAYAASCNPALSYGSVSVDVGTLPDSGIYTIWTRMQAADSTHSRYQLEVNGDTCFTVGGSEVSATQWEWVDYQDDGQTTPVKYEFIAAAGNKLRLIGIEQAVKIDALLIIPDDCVPIDIGDNCRSATHATPLTTPLPTDTMSTVAGTVDLLSLLPSNSSEVRSVEYSAEGKKLQKSNGPAGFDTTLLSNGEHTVTVKVAYADGTAADKTLKMEISNETTALSPFYRWARLNKGSLLVFSIALGLVSAYGLSWSLLKRSHMKRHYERTHGL